MSVILFQFPVVLAILLALIGWLKPWRMRAEASAVVYVVLGMFYALSYVALTRVGPIWAFVQSFDKDLGLLLILSGFLIPFLLGVVIRHFDLERKDSHPPRIIEQVLHAIGLAFLIGLLSVFAYGLTIGRVLSLRARQQTSTNFFFQFGLACTYPLVALLLLDIFLNWLFFIFPGSAVTGLLRPYVSRFQKIYLLVGIPLLIIILLSLGFASIEQAVTG